MDTILGAIMIYSWVHFAIIQHSNNYKLRTPYQKVVTWVSLTAFILFVIGSLT